MKDVAGEIIAFIVGAMLSVLVVAIPSGGCNRHRGREEGRAEVQQDAVLKGHAEYVPSESGASQWQWIERSEP